VKGKFVINDKIEIDHLSKRQLFDTSNLVLVILLAVAIIYAITGPLPEFLADRGDQCGEKFNCINPRPKPSSLAAVSDNAPAAKLPGVPVR
jgi:hypothetical protein